MDKDYTLYRGTGVEDGEAVMKIDAVGDHTLYGQLSKELSLGDDRLSPLQVKLKNLADMISRFGYIAAGFLFVVFMFQKIVINNEFDGEAMGEYLSQWDLILTDSLDAIVLAIIVLVAAVPEGLPMMIAIVLSLNMQKMLREKVLVRKLLGIETAGSLSILFSDKTGTLTRGKLEPRFFITGTNETYQSYEAIPEKLRTYLKIAIAGNTASHRTSDGEITGGNFSERALLGYIPAEEDLSTLEDAELIHKIHFNSTRKFSATELKFPGKLGALDSDEVVLLKGAPEILMKDINKGISEEGRVIPLQDKDKMTKYMDGLADAGIRLLAIAVSTHSLNQDEHIPEELILVGVIGMQDALRETTKGSVELVKQAGVQVVMITGDRKGTASSIAKEAGVIDDHHQVVLESSDLQKMSDEEIAEILPDLRVIARALPTDKSRMVRISKSKNEVVGMTGDGVNDSAALKQSDVGVAMGSGSEVTKEAGDIVILDDNFNSISNAIRYGRTIFKSIRKFITFQLTVNVAAVSITILGPIINVDFPLTIIQLLWINLIMDTLGAIALGGEPALMRYMEEEPIKRDDNILSRQMISSILVNGLFITAFSVMFLKMPYFKELFSRGGPEDYDVFITAFFNIFIFQVLFNMLNVRSSGLNFLEHIGENRRFLQIIFLILILQVFFTYVGGEILRTVPLTRNEWFNVILFSVLIIPVDFIRKIIFSKRQIYRDTVRILFGYR
jgi:calcium-translocating P-type ATPase